ncbi:MAG TPA: uroporphyrinogen-III synthase [Thermoanaerobaculia bacterium]|nr:uroporphyrinogen-III synthase [Thermoanaerobaculia bacterium]
MTRILLLRSGSPASDDALPGDVTVLYTHSVVPRPEGVAEALAFDARGATLVVSSKETVTYLLPLFRAPFVEMVAVGEGTGDLLRRVKTGGSGGFLRKADSKGAGASRPGGESKGGGEAAWSIVVPEVPGAAGVVHFLRESSAPSLLRVLWPHGSDAAPEPLEEIRALGIQLVAPVVYEKRALSPSELNPSILADFHAGRFAAVAVGSTAGLDVLLAALGSPATPPPNVRWGVLGPETAKALAARGLPPPSIPAHARLSELLDLLRKETR